MDWISVRPDILAFCPRWLSLVLKRLNGMSNVRSVHSRTWLTFCGGFSYRDDNNAAAQSTCSRSLARSDQAARRKPAGTESQVEPTDGAQPNALRLCASSSCQGLRIAGP
jgi:hypothetical protein